MNREVMIENLHRGVCQGVVPPHVSAEDVRQHFLWRGEPGPQRPQHRRQYAQQEQQRQQKDEDEDDQQE